MRVVAIVSLGASAILGLGALFVAKTVLPGPMAAKPAVVVQAGRPVVVAKQDIKYGQKLEAGFLTIARVPAEAIPEGAFTSLDQVLSQDRGGAPVALVPISAREPLLPAKLSGPGARPSVAAEIADGLRAYTIKVSDVSGVGGHALPGDRVDVVLMRNLAADGDPPNLVSNVVLQNVRVLGIDLNADLNSNKPSSPNTATLEVSVADAQKLSVASTLGSLSLALRRTGEAELSTATSLVARDFLGGPARAVGRRSSPRPARSYAPTIIIEVAGSGRSARRRAEPVAEAEVTQGPAAPSPPAPAGA